MDILGIGEIRAYCNALRREGYSKTHVATLLIVAIVGGVTGVSWVTIKTIELFGG